MDIVSKVEAVRLKQHFVELELDKPVESNQNLVALDKRLAELHEREFLLVVSWLLSQG